jgi:hypothetical protein
MKNNDIHLEYQQIIPSNNDYIDPLKVLTHFHDDGTVEVISCWKASLWERLVILFTGKILIHTLGDKLPPIKCSIEYGHVIDIIEYRKKLIRTLTARQENN